MKFKEIVKNEQLLKGINELNIEEATTIQEEIIPFINKGFDVFGQSQTGTGKTLAFSSPILDKIKENKRTQALVLAPTRELAMQIADNINLYSKYLNVNVTCVYGSSSIMDQIRKLEKGSEIVIGTPGRVTDLIKRNKLKLDNLEYLVLDEADEMVSMGFQEELEFIIGSIKSEKQVLLFSATMPKKVMTIAEKYMKKDYKMVTVKTDKQTSINVTQEYYVSTNHQRLEVLTRILDFHNFNKTIIFVRTKIQADELMMRLSKKGYSCGVIHGDIIQEQRIKTLELFKNSSFNLLIATDVAARGIHVDDIELVVNYNLPESSEIYVHRIGRTARNNKKGLAITLITDREKYMIKEIERRTKSAIMLGVLPTKEQIMNNKIETIVEEVKTLIDKKPEIESISNYIAALTEVEVKNILSNLLINRLNDSLGSDLNESIEKSGNYTEDNRSRGKNRRFSEDSVRVFVTIGRVDNFEKRDFLSFIEKKANVDQGTCSNLEILNTFTFMNIDKKHFDKVMNSCHNSNYKGRTIRIEKAKK